MKNDRYRLVLPVLVLSSSLGGMLAISQVTTGTISGTVKDQTGAVVPGATVTVTNVGTGQRRAVESDAQGRYRAPELASGDYEMQASSPGFQTSIRRGITMSVGREAVVDLLLEIGEVTQQVVVTGEAPLVDAAKSAVSGLVEETQIRELPLNLRSYEGLATLERGVHSVGQAGAGSARGGFGTFLTIGGARPEYNSFQIDNVDVSDMFRKTPGSAAGGAMGVESIKEFSVETSNYSAEFGLSPGGVINAITRSGTNQIDGSVYWYLRNDNLDAARWEDNAFGEGKPEFRRNQFGVALGGPIRRDRTFFFGNYEGLRQAQPSTTTFTVPTEAAKRGILTPSRTVTVVPQVVPYLNLFPLPNGRDHGDGTADFITPTPRTTANDYFLVRLDHRFSDLHSLSGRFLFEEGQFLRDEEPLPQQVNLQESKRRNVSLQDQIVITPQLLHDFRFGLTRSILNDFDKITGLPESLNFIPLSGRVLGQLTISGVDGFGHGATTPLFYTNNFFQYLDNVSYTKGSHALKWGTDIRRFQINGLNASRLHGRYRFNSLEDFLTGRSARDFEMLLPGAGRDSPFYIRQSLFGFYIQDKYRARTNLTFDLGLRYEFISVPTEKYGKVANMRDRSDTRSTIGDPFFENPSLKNFGPRFGFAWDPWSSGKTSVRGGFGLLHEQIVGGSYINSTMFRVPPFFVRLLIQNASFPDQYQRTAGNLNLDTVDVFQQFPGDIQINFFEFRPKNPYMLHFNFEVQHEIFPSTVLSVGYMGSRGAHLARQADSNTPIPVKLPDGRWFYPAGARRRNPTFTVFAEHVLDANSIYNSLQVSLRKRFTRGFLFQGSYSWAHSIDDASGTQSADRYAGGTTSRIWEDRTSDRGHSGFDVRHNFTFNSVWDLPVGTGRAFGSNLTGAADWLLSGWQVNGIVKLRTGVPGTVSMSPNISQNLGGGDRPDVVAGINPVQKGNPQQYLRADAFAIPPLGTHGNVGRNTVILPGQATVDFSLFKTIRISEAIGLQFRGEAFNLLNRVNFGQPSLGAVTGSVTRPVFSPTFGRITTTSSSAREIQLGMKVAW